MADCEDKTIPAAPGRRSRRLASRATMKSPDSPAKVQEEKPPPEPRRNPKRKSSHVNPQALELPDDLLTAAYEPLTDQEREEWEGWVELESDPASFNYILSELGVKGVQVQELFSIDDESLDLLPKPVHGLIFLFQYQPEVVDDDVEAQAEQVWFANQTSHNACATVALLNIAMNIEGIQLGEKLQEFKHDTTSLSPPLRGDRITVNSFIRSKHNSFASRIDLLGADLALENNVEAGQMANKKRPSPKKRKGRVSLRRGEEHAFHFIAYVAAQGFVWELDGLRPQPNKLGPVTTGDWTTIATPQIEARIMQYAESQLAFNLLALCQTPLAAHRQQILDHMASLRYIRSQLNSNHDFVKLVSGEELALLDIENPRQLADYDLKPCDVSAAPALRDVVEKLSGPGVELGDAYDLYLSHVGKVKQAMMAYQAEMKTDPGLAECAQTQRAPWNPAIHRFINALAEKDALMSIIRSS